MMRRLVLLLLLAASLASATRFSDEDVDEDEENLCPLNMNVLKRHFYGSDKKSEEQKFTRLTEALGHIREEGRAQTSKMTNLAQKMEQKLGKLESKIERSDHRRDSQISTMQREIQRTQNETLPLLAESLELQLNKSERNAFLLNENFEANVLKIAEPVLEKIDTKFADVDERLDKFRTDLNNFGGGMVQKIETMVNTVLSLKRGLKEEIFKCGKALKLKLTMVTAGTFYFSPNISNWHAAKAFCEENDMQLAKIPDDKRLQEIDDAAPNHNAWYWVSGSDVGYHPGEFHWADGSVVTNDMWDKGQPSSFGAGYETCVFLYTQNAKLSDYRCTNKEFFVCELGPECYHKN